MRLIVNADDFGASEDVNAAVVTARREGVLTSASLMMTGSRVAEAVAIAKQDPGLAVGLHLTLSNGVGLLPPRLIPGLVDKSGRFPDSPVRAALRYYFDSGARHQLRLEIEAQLRAFAETGLRLSHVDGHQHLHAHPVVAPIAIELAVRYGASGFRVPNDPFGPSLRADRSGLAVKAVVGVGHALFAGGCRRLANETGLATCEATVGCLMSGRMSADYVIGLLGRLDWRAVEIFFHPSVSDGVERYGPNKGDLDALVDPRVRRFIEQGGHVLSTYAGLGKEVSLNDVA